MPRPAWLDRLGVFDLETTGLNIFGSRIVSACVGVIDEHGTVLQQAYWLADPGVEIPEVASAVNGITTAFAQQHGGDARETVAAILDRLRFLIESRIVIVAYNGAYDFSLLHYEAQRHGLEPLPERFPIVDPFILDKHIDPYRRGKRKLVATCEHYGVPFENAHEASADAFAAGRLAQALFAHPKASKLPQSLREVYDLQISAAAEQAVGFQEYLRRTSDPYAVIGGEWPVRSREAALAAEAEVAALKAAAGIVDGAVVTAA